MAYFIGFDPIAQPGRGAEAVAAGYEMISGTAGEVRLAVSDGTTLVLHGSAFRYSEDGDLLGGKVDGFEFLDGERPIFVASEIDLSAAAVLGFLADGRLDQLNAYLYSGHDLIEGSPGGDRIDAAYGEDLVYGNGGPDQIRGGDGEDTLDGGDGNDLVTGGNGNDLIAAGDGHDMIFGNTGRDTITGGAGDDTIFGGKEYDIIYGGEGHDRIYTDLGGDDVWGDAGNDTIYVEGDEEDWVFFGSGSGQDRIDGFDATTGDRIFIVRHINNTDIVDFATLVDRIADDQFGNAIVDLGGANYFRLTDVDLTQADAGWFAFYDPSDFASAPPLLGAAAV